MGVPAEPALNLVAAHRAVTRDDVLDVAGQQVTVMRQSIGERRAVIEDVLGGLFAALDTRPEGVVGGPVVQHLAFEGREVRRAAGGFGVTIRGHGTVSCAFGRSVGMGRPHRTRGRRRAGARAPRYHPAYARAGAYVALCRLSRAWTVRFYWARGFRGRFFRRLPGDIRIDAARTILTSAVPDPGDAVLAAHRGSHRRSPTMDKWLDTAFRQRRTRPPQVEVSSVWSVASSCGGHGWSSRCGSAWQRH